jgi:hypothetical protein
MDGAWNTSFADFATKKSYAARENCVALVGCGKSRNSRNGRVTSRIAMQKTPTRTIAVRAKPLARQGSGFASPNHLSVA